MKKAKYHKVLLWLLWIGTLAMTVLLFFEKEQFVTVLILWLLAVAVTFMYVFKSKATVSDDMRKVLSIMFDFSTWFLILNYISMIIEYIRES